MGWLRKTVQIQSIFVNSGSIKFRLNFDQEAQEKTLKFNGFSGSGGGELRVSYTNLHVLLRICIYTRIHALITISKYNISNTA